MSEDKKSKEPLKWDNDLMRQFFDPIVNPERHEFNEGQVFKREIKGDPPRIKYTTANKDAGRNSGINKTELEPLVMECLEIKIGESEKLAGTVAFINKDNRVFPTRIADYLITEKDLPYKSTEQIAKKVASILDSYPGIKKEGNFYYLVD